MKKLSALLGGLIVSLPVMAQQQQQQAAPPSPPGVRVIDFRKVQKDVITTWDRRNLAGLPIQSPARAEDPSEFPRVNNTNVINVTDRDRVRYRYALLEIANGSGGGKQIKAVEWDFVHPRVVDGRVVLRHAVRSEAGVKPGEVRRIKVSLPESGRCGVNFLTSDKPLPVPAARAPAGRGCQRWVNVRPGWDAERVRLLRVEYADGTEWRRP